MQDTADMEKSFNISLGWEPVHSIIHEYEKCKSKDKAEERGRYGVEK